jgi:hypothetical protein
MAPWFAVAIFLGLRPDSELNRCRFEHFNWEEGHLKVLESKNGTKFRFVELNDAIRAWIDPWRNKKGFVKVQKNHRRRYEQIIKGYYTTEKAKFRDRNTWKALVQWDTDITRHTYGSYFEAENRGDAGCREKLASNMGHTSFKTFNTYYRNSRTKKEAAIFWGSRPPGFQLPNVLKIA